MEGYYAAENCSSMLSDDASPAAEVTLRESSKVPLLPHGKRKKSTEEQMILRVDEKEDGVGDANKEQIIPTRQISTGELSSVDGAKSRAESAKSNSNDSREADSGDVSRQSSAMSIEPHNASLLGAEGVIPERCGSRSCFTIRKTPSRDYSAEFGLSGYKFLPPKSSASNEKTHTKLHSSNEVHSPRKQDNSTVLLLSTARGSGNNEVVGDVISSESTARASPKTKWRSVTTKALSAERSAAPRVTSHTASSLLEPSLYLTTTAITASVTSPMLQLRLAVRALEVCREIVRHARVHLSFGRGNTNRGADDANHHNSTGNNWEENKSAACVLSSQLESVLSEALVYNNQIHNDGSSTQDSAQDSALVSPNLSQALDSETLLFVNAANHLLSRMNDITEESNPLQALIDKYETQLYELARKLGGDNGYSNTATTDISRGVSGVSSSAGVGGSGDIGSPVSGGESGSPQNRRKFWNATKKPWWCCRRYREKITREIVSIEEALVGLRERRELLKLQYQEAMDELERISDIEHVRMSMSMNFSDDGDGAIAIVNDENTSEVVETT